MQALVHSIVGVLSNKKDLNFYYMIHLLKWAVDDYKLLSITVNDIVCTFYFKIVLILLHLEAGAIQKNPRT